MHIDWMLVATVAAPTIALFVGAFLDRLIQQRPRLISYLGHTASFKVRGDKSFSVYTHSIVIRNSGRKPARNVRVGHHFLPPNYEIYPRIPYEVKPVADSGHELLIPVLVPNEQVTISYLYEQPLTVDNIHSYTKYDDGYAKIIRVLPAKQFPRWVNVTVGGFMILGVIAFLYLVVIATRHFVK